MFVIDILHGLLVKMIFTVIDVVGRAQEVDGD